ncbi:MAG: alpha/beta fold hydrolase [Actinobacteria bacterium]|nr:alpha/beta fold hydrolase [Actinomycetota bacterium]
MADVVRAGNRISYEATGAGPPVLFVHGYPLNSTLWDPQVAALRGSHRCLVPDLLGFGRSDAPADVDLYSVEAYAADLLAVMDDAGVEKATVCSLSMGGYITFALLRSAPERVDALILADTRAEADSDEGRANRAAQQDLLRSEGTGPVIDALVNGPLLADATRKTKPDVVARLRRVMANPAPGFLGALEAMMKRPDSARTLGRIEVPTLFIVGDEDAITPVEVVRDMHETVPGSKLVVIPGVGHISNLEAPEAFNDAVTGFLSAKN